MIQKQSQLIQKEQSHTRGFSSVEVVLSAAIFGLMVTAFVGAYLYGEESNTLSGHRLRATLLAEEGIEATRNIRDNNFTSLTNGTHGLATTSNQWTFSGVSDVFGIFTRQIIISEVSADKKTISSTVSWQQNQQRAGSVTLVSSLNNWSEVVPASCDAFAVQEGYSTGTCRQNSGQCSGNSEDYLPDGDVFCIDSPSADTCCALPDVVQSCSGTPTACTALASSPSCSAQSGCSWGGGGTSGSTTNIDFDVNTSGWAYADWDQGGGEVNVTGSRSATNGNPNGWIYINFPSGKSDELGGYWQQTFTTDSANPNVSLDFDWIVSQYDPTPNTFIAYVFVDSISGEPIIGQEVWSSGERTSTTGWASVSNLDVSSKVSSAGTYYLKLAVWVETNGGANDGPYEIGYDNVQLDWTPTSSCSGTATACTTFGNQSSCQLQGGCSWN